MKLLLVLAVLLYTADAQVKCVQGSDGTLAATVCTDDVVPTLCSQPKFVEYTGMSAGVLYACGPCAAGTKDTTCEECTASAEDGCNKPKQTGADFNCFSYTFTKEAFAKSAKAIACKRLEDTDLICNKPSKDATDKTYSGSGCGPCAGDTKGTSCSQCTTDSCNSAMKPMFFIIPFLTILYNLF